MASASITARRRRTGLRYVVRYRLGGRAYPIEHGGSFKTLREARARRDFIAGELAAGRNPAEALSALTAQETPRRTFRQWADSYEKSRLDVGERTRAVIRSHFKKILPPFEDRDPATITPADVQDWIASADLAPASLKRYMATFRLVLDFAGVDPNPARDRRVKLPQVVEEEPEPPSASDFLTILGRVPRRAALPLAVIEQTAMRTQDVLGLTWGDVDVSGARFRLPRQRTKMHRPRWIQVPDWLMGLVAAICPPEDRIPERRVFQGLSEKTLYHAIDGACRAAEIAHYHPHDLRHRRISLWHGQGIPAKEIAERSGHARASMSLDRYSHVMPLEEVGQARYEEVLAP
jgi:integrase